MVLMALSVLTCVLQCYINLENYDLFNHEAPGLNLWRFPAEVVNDEQAAEFARRRESIDELTKIASGLSLVNFMTAIAFLTWLHQSAWNLRILSANGFSFTPAQAVWSAFIPLANVIVVYLAIQEIWRASDPGATRTPRSWREVPHSKLIMLAWLAFLGAILVSFYRSANYHSWESEWFLCAAIVNLCMMVTGATLIGVIYQIGQRQRARHAKIYDEAA
jgi:hypothetical protein